MSHDPSLQWELKEDTIGSFEKHTKGIRLKSFTKIGYASQGLERMAKG
jgi:hypothetical protein